MATNEIKVSIDPVDMLTAHALEVIDRQNRCPYCHKSGKHTNAYGRFNDWQRITHSNRLDDNFLVTRVPGHDTLLMHVNYCPMCGRKLRGDSNGD